MGTSRTIFSGAACTLAAQVLLRRLLLLRFRRDVAQLNEGNYRPLLRAYADDAILRFNEGPHRWAGEHRGKAKIVEHEDFYEDSSRIIELEQALRERGMQPVVALAEPEHA